MVKFDDAKLGNVCDVLNGDRGYNYPASKDFVEFGIPFINAGNIFDKRIKFENVDYIAKEHYDRLSGVKFRKGDIVFCLRGSLGKFALLEFERGAPASSLAVLRTYADKLNNQFLLHILGSNIIASQISAQNNGSSQPNLSAESVKGFMIPLPEISEQRAIAEVLSDIDNLISSLKKLIDKKKVIKQGAMEGLLTGKRRLPGFNGEWVDINLAENSRLKARIGWQGLTKAEYLSSGYAYLITGTDFSDGRIDWDTCYFVDRYRFEQDPNIQIRNGDILITKDGTIGKVAIICNLKKAATLNSGVFVIRPLKQENYVSEFVYHILSSFIFEKFLEKLSAGSTISHLYQKDFVSFVFKAPASLKEQQAIAQILTDMDNEIEQLEKKLIKYQQIKQGMMQELLTGHIRLVNNGEET